MAAERLSASLGVQQPLANLVSWAEGAVREGEFAEADFTVVRGVVARLG